MDLDASTSTGVPAASPARHKSSEKPAKGQKFKRRHYFIAPNVQVRMTAELVLLWFVGAALALVNLYVLYSLGELYQSDALRVGPAHWEENLMVWAYGVISVVVAAVIFLLACIYYTHRIAGPQRKLEQHLTDMADGDLRPRVALRKSDHLRELARAINSVARRSDQSITNLRATVERLRQVAEAGDVSAVLEHCTELEKALSHYKLSADETK